MQVLNRPESDILAAIESQSTGITIIGLGKMGLPLAMVFTHAGFNVVGYDISADLVNTLNQGKTMLEEPMVSERLEQAVKTKLFSASTSLEESLANSSFAIIIIPVLSTESGHADLAGLLPLYDRIEKNSPPGLILIQESTLPPKTTSGVIKETLEKRGKISGTDFGLVFAPERTFSGRVIEDIEVRYPKILGGDTANAAFAASILYQQVCQKGVLQLSNATTAEAVKTFKGAYRDANIAIANQLSLMADIYQVDIMEVIDAANTEPFSNIHLPGFGVGGHCIPVYPKFLIADAISNNIPDIIFKRAREANDAMIDYAINSVENYIDSWHASVLVLGLAYRGGVKEARNSPTLRLVPELLARRAQVTVSDPVFSKEEVNSLLDANIGAPWDESQLTKYDIIFIVTDHKEFSGIESKIKAKVVYDGRFVLFPQKSNQFKLLQPGRLYVESFRNDKTISSDQIKKRI
ncbi:MAG: nucleotide sugar dehydrogenase [Candidatus Kariarchaeaceae archaeon]|jgi:UDP-N-acetyl-D-mannosaminuronic acid dehydrogenase